MLFEILHLATQPGGLLAGVGNVPFQGNHRFSRYLQEETSSFGAITKQIQAEITQATAYMGTSSKSN